MYMMFLQGSPWEKRVSFLPNSVMVLAKPAELRKASASNEASFFLPFAGLLGFIRLSSGQLVPRDCRGLRCMAGRPASGTDQTGLDLSRVWDARRKHERRTLCRAAVRSSASFLPGLCQAVDRMG